MSQGGGDLCCTGVFLIAGLFIVIFFWDAFVSRPARIKQYNQEIYKKEEEIKKKIENLTKEIEELHEKSKKLSGEEKNQVLNLSHQRIQMLKQYTKKLEEIQEEYS